MIDGQPTKINSRDQGQTTQLSGTPEWTPQVRCPENGGKLTIALIRLIGWARTPDAHAHYHAHPTDAAYLVGLTM